MRESRIQEGRATIIAARPEASIRSSGGRNGPREPKLERVAGPIAVTVPDPVVPARLPVASMISTSRSRRTGFPKDFIARGVRRVARKSGLAVFLEEVTVEPSRKVSVRVTNSSHRYRRRSTSAGRIDPHCPGHVSVLVPSTHGASDGARSKFSLTMCMAPKVVAADTGTETVRASRAARRLRHGSASHWTLR